MLEVKMLLVHSMSLCKIFFLKEDFYLKTSKHMKVWKRKRNPKLKGPE